MNYLIESYSNPVTNALSLYPFYRTEEWGPKRAINPKLTQMRLESRFLWLQVQAFNHWILQVPWGKLLGLSHSAWFASRAWPALEFIHVSGTACFSKPSVHHSLPGWRFYAAYCTQGTVEARYTYYLNLIFITTWYFFLSILQTSNVSYRKSDSLAEATQ